MLATQLENREPSPVRRRGLLAEWVEFLSTDANIVELNLASRTPQELLDATSGQRGLRKLEVKWGPYRDLSALSTLQGLEDVALGGATGVDSLEPLISLPVLSRLYVSQAHKADGAVLGAAVGLRDLASETLVRVPIVTSTFPTSDGSAGSSSSVASSFQEPESSTRI